MDDQYERHFFYGMHTILQTQPMAMGYGGIEAADLPMAALMIAVRERKELSHVQPSLFDDFADLWLEWPTSGRTHLKHWRVYRALTAKG